MGRNGKGCLRKNPLPIHCFQSNFHLLSLYGLRVFSLSLVVQLVSVQLSKPLELMRQLYYFTLEGHYIETNAHPRLFCFINGWRILDLDQNFFNR